MGEWLIAFASVGISVQPGMDAADRRGQSGRGGRDEKTDGDDSHGDADAVESADDQHLGKADAGRYGDRRQSCGDRRGFKVVTDRSRTGRRARARASMVLPEQIATHATVKIANIDSSAQASAVDGPKLVPTRCDVAPTWRPMRVTSPVPPNQTTTTGAGSRARTRMGRA